MGQAYKHAISKERYTHDPKRNTRPLNRKGSGINYYIEIGLSHSFDPTFELDRSQKSRHFPPNDYYFYYLLEYLNPNPN